MEVALVATRFVVVAFVAVKPTMFAADALRVLAIAVVKFVSVEKREVDVAFPRVGFCARRLSMTNEVRIGSLRLKFLIDDADNDGRLTMFDMTVLERARVPVTHYHRDFEEVWYGLGGALTVTLDGVAHQLKSGDALFVPRCAVHRFVNLDAGKARAVVREVSRSY